MNAVLSPKLYNSFSKIDINKEYFGIKLDTLKYDEINTSYFFKGVEKLTIGSYNSIIVRNEVINLAKELFREYNLDFAEVYLSTEAHKVFDIVDDFNNKVLNSENNFNGWLIFVDPCKIANWSHRCEYWFVMDKDNIIKNLNAKWAPSSFIDLEKLEM